MIRINSRIKREEKTLIVTIEMFCRDNHSTKNELCADCKELLNYALDRLSKCPFPKNKPTCAKCTVHCYKPLMREKIRDVMRYSGPRMTYEHPVLAFFHLIDGLKSPESH